MVLFVMVTDLLPGTADSYICWTELLAELGPAMYRVFVVTFARMVDGRLVDGSPSLAQDGATMQSQY